MKPLLSRAGAPGSLVGIVAMTPATAIPVFLVSLAVSLGAASRFARTLDRLGVRVGLAEPMLGLLTALAADGPEISSVVVALVKGSTGVGVGVVVGSNVFNLAAMLGLSAVLVGGIRLRREALVLEGSVAVLVTALAIAVVEGALPASAATALVVCLLVPYVALLARGHALSRRLPLPGALERRLERALTEREHWGDHTRIEEAAAWRLVALTVPTVALIVAGSVGMVEAAASLAGRFGLSGSLLGLLVLAPLTSLPNAWTALRLARAGRGAALVSETMNSNTVNLVAGLVVPALVVRIGAGSRGGSFAFAWLALMTLTALAGLSAPAGLGRRLGGLLLAGFVVFCVVEIAWG